MALTTACKQYSPAAGATQSYIAYTQNVSGNLLLKPKMMMTAITKTILSGRIIKKLRNDKKSFIYNNSSSIYIPIL